MSPWLFSTRLLDRYMPRFGRESPLAPQRRAGRQRSQTFTSEEEPRQRYRCPTMASFPPFMKTPANRIAAQSQHTDGIEGYVFDGVDGTQVAFWESTQDATTEEHIHEFDEYFIVVEGQYIVVIDGTEIQVGAGEECVIPRGARIRGEVTAGTRTIHMFGGTRASRDIATRAQGNDGSAQNSRGRGP